MLNDCVVCQRLLDRMNAVPGRGVRAAWRRWPLLREYLRHIRTGHDRP